ncbi:transglutaminase family protein [Luteipulveratus sp. YIM 133132]|uniref:transglutaminase family protein n=1 Tax=Luteipulveratus flavus TaxID=3031728 RepID=UPI0023B15E0B|nr:transglutaminase family protein [Luteipulveratus sp. YIM 133132]MDE9364998.1 transglutaminase family protein [Luteipulveratus sp. YIM 133132]
MTLRLHHQTGYTYKGGATASYNEARMQPQSNLDQTVLHTKVDVSPNPWTMSWTDYWGTLVTSFEVHERHPELLVDATSTVTVDRRPAETSHLSWEEMVAPEVTDAWLEVLGVTPRVSTGPELSQELAAMRESAAAPDDFVDAVVELLRSRVEYVRGRTTAHARAADAWAAGSGGCQDLAHLTIGALRSYGIPARYVSGYMFPDPEPQIGRPYAGDSHAWIQWWDGAWVPVDPAHGVPPDDHYVDVGVGRDHKDVVPLSGIFTGSPGSTMFTRVEMTRLA